MGIGYSRNGAREIVSYGNAHGMTNFEIASSSYRIAKLLNMDFSPLKISI